MQPFFLSRVLGGVPEREGDFIFIYILFNALTLVDPLIAAKPLPLCDTSCIRVPAGTNCFGSFFVISLWTL